MRVLVAGGTGFIGTNLCAELYDRGHEVTAMSRDPSGADLPEGVGRVAADVSTRTSTDAGSPTPSLLDAVEGHDAIVNLVSLSPLFEPPAGTSHEAVHLRGTEQLVAAAEATDLERFVQISGLGVDPDGPTEYLRAKGRAEGIVRESDLDWVIARPSIVFGAGAEILEFTTLLTTPYVTGLPAGGRTPFQPIWVGDFVPMLAEMVEDDEHIGEAYEIGGPEVLTLKDITELIYRAEGKPVTVLPIPMILAKIGLSLAGPIPFIPFGPDHARSLAIDNTVEENAVTAFGHSEDGLLTMAAFLDVEDPETPRLRSERV